VEGDQMLCAQNNYLKTKADGLKCELSIKEAEISNLKTRLEATQRSDHETRSHLEGTVAIIKLITAIKIPKIGLNRDLNPGPLAPKARIIPLDH
jgi:hypothetical protein